MVLAMWIQSAELEASSVGFCTCDAYSNMWWMVLADTSMVYGLVEDN